MNDALFLSVLQIVLESFPVSSSGHLLLVACLSGGEVAGYTEMWNRLMHLPTLFMVIFFFRDSLIVSIRACFRRPTIMSKQLFLAGGATIVTLGFYCYGYDFLSHSVPLWVGFSVTALVLASLYYIVTYRVMYCDTQWSMMLVQACLLGFAQSCAFLPGVSRLAMTYSCARWMGRSGRRSLELSLLLHSMLIIGGLILSYAKREMVLIPLTQGYEYAMLVAATIIAYGGLWFVALCARKHSMWKFSLYMMLPIVVAYMLCYSK
ncbi:MAG: undecaprenyl-diphosphate phosphatase [Candidatus Babeliales bacterium]